MGKSFADFVADINKLSNESDLDNISTQQFADACAHLQPIFDGLGTVLAFASSDFKSKTADLKGCAGEFSILNAVLQADIKADTVTVKNSHSRNLRGLRRGLHFIQLIMKALVEDAAKALSAAAGGAYDAALGPYHPWAIRMAVKAGLRVLPYRETFVADMGETEETFAEKTPGLVGDMDALIAAVDKIFPPEALNS